MDEIMGQYLEKLTDQCMQNAAFANLDEAEKDNLKQRLDQYFSQVIIEVVVDNLTEAQFSQIENLDPQSPEMIVKIEELTAQIPNASLLIEQKLQQVALDIQQTGQIPALS